MPREVEVRGHETGISFVRRSDGKVLFRLGASAANGSFESVAVGELPASTGAIRLPYGEAGMISHRDKSGTGDIPGIARMDSPAGLPGEGFLVLDPDGWGVELSPGGGNVHVTGGSSLLVYSGTDARISLRADGSVQLLEVSDPSAPLSNRVKIYARDNGAGKTQLVARFSTGDVQVLAEEP